MTIVHIDSKKQRVVVTDQDTGATWTLRKNIEDRENPVPDWDDCWSELKITIAKYTGATFNE